MFSCKNPHVFCTTFCCDNSCVSFANKAKNNFKSAEFHGQSSEAYRMKISPLKLMILMNIQLGVICTSMVDFSQTWSHIYCIILVDYHSTTLDCLLKDILIIYKFLHCIIK